MMIDDWWLMIDDNDINCLQLTMQNCTSFLHFGNLLSKWWMKWTSLLEAPVQTRIDILYHYKSLHHTLYLLCSQNWNKSYKASNIATLISTAGSVTEPATPQNMVFHSDIFSYMLRTRIQGWGKCLLWKWSLQWTTHMWHDRPGREKRV